MTDHFALLEASLPTVERLANAPRELGYFGQEAMRFYSIAGSLRASFPLDNSSAEERYMTHIQARSLLEGYFWVIYIFDDPAERTARYEQLLNGFKREYAKLWNEKLVPGKAQLDPPDPTWATLPAPMDVNSMLGQVRNDYGDRLNFLYFVYRVSSFDTHGRSLINLFDSSFGKAGMFPALNLKYGIDLMANQYLVVLQELQSRGEV